MTPNRYTLKCWLRFKGISQSQTDQLLRECAEDYPIKTKMNGKPSDMNALILLEEGKSFEKLKHFITHHYPTDNGSYDLFISVTTENDSEIITVPEAVTHLLRDIGGGVHFSFTAV
jgi:hypothetical protein